MTVSEEAQRLPRVDVLMATYNGRRWIEPQIDSILDQNGVDVRLIVSDDGSEDGTVEYLGRRARENDRITLLPPHGGPRGVTANFLHLFTAHPITNDVLVALSDQDDVWRADKLRTQIGQLRFTGADAVSSNVESFNEEGRRRLVVKNEPQQRWDFIFEAAGPGSTYLFTSTMHARLVSLLADLDTSQIGVHDWFLYALVRAAGGTWSMSAEPLVAYRQHADNVQGEHHGLAAFRQRLGALRSGFYRDQFVRTAQACRQVGQLYQDATWVADLDALIADLAHRDIGSRLRIARRCRDIRRDRIEGVALAVSCVLGVW